ncbi:MAG: single-stranded DNA-binding protein [Elusimicrobiota bacterium]
MSISYNKIILVGRLVRDPDIRFTTSGTQVSVFTVAVDRPSRSGMNDNDNTDFIRVVTFGKTAEFVGNYLVKGRLILVEGSLRIRKWTTQDGDKRSTTEVLANNIRFMETKSQAGITDNSTFDKDVDESSDDESDIDTSEDITFFGSEQNDKSDDQPPF